MRTVRRVRPPAVAETFYPADAAELRAVVESCLGGPGTGPAPKAIIAPHAGYAFSGPVAGSAYARILRAPVSRVVLLGPAHRTPDAGIAASSADAFSTPVGEVTVDT